MKRIIIEVPDWFDTSHRVIIKDNEGQSINEAQPCRDSVSITTKELDRLRKRSLDLADLETTLSIGKGE